MAPLQVTSATTVGELLADPRTADMIIQMLVPIQQKAAVSEAADGSDTQMMQALLEGLPLKSLAVLGVTGEMIENMIIQLNQVCK